MDGGKEREREGVLEMEREAEREGETACVWAMVGGRKEEDSINSTLFWYSSWKDDRIICKFHSPVYIMLLFLFRFHYLLWLAQIFPFLYVNALNNGISFSLHRALWRRPAGHHGMFSYGSGHCRPDWISNNDSEKIFCSLTSSQMCQNSPDGFLQLSCCFRRHSRYT